MHWYLEVLKKYAVFSGRARRKEYWMFLLINLLITMGLALVDGMMGTFDPASAIGVFSGIYTLAVLVPSIAVTFRRLHDIGRSGWWLLIGLIPLIGMIVLLVFAVLDSESGSNQYGPNPKGGADFAGGAAMA